MRQAPEIIDVIEQVVAGMNGEDTDDYTSVLNAVLPKVQAGPTTTLTQLLQQVIGTSYRAIQYYPGHPLEIINTIKEKDWGSQKYEKFPAVCLFLDTIEEHGKHRFAYTAPSLQIMMLWYTEPTYTSQDRHDKNFVPILLPMYREFIRQCANSNLVANVEEELLQFGKINHYFWGKQGLYGVQGNIFNDYLDCLEIRNLSLNINFLNCQ